MFRSTASMLVACLLCAVACSSSGGNGGGGGSAGATGGTNTGGNAQGGNAQGGNAQGGSDLGGAGGTAGSAGSAGSAGGASGGKASGGAGSGGSPSAGSGGGSASGGNGGAASGGASGGQAGSAGQGGRGGQAGGGAAGSGGQAGAGGSTVACPSTVLSPGNQKHTIQVGGRNREYYLHVPAGYKGDKAVPLLVDFHPHGSSGSDWQTGSPYPAVTDADGVVVAFPSANAGGDWNVGPCCADGVDDVEFARALVKEIKGLACIDEKRVFAAGFSMGGGMTNYVACHAADVFAAFAPASFDILQEIVADCKPGRPVAVISFRGTNDNMVPYNGGVSNLVKPITFLGAVNTMKKWAEYSGCTGSAADIGNNCQGYSATQCQAGVEVVLCTKQGGGHEAANATVTWPLLKRHALP